MEWVHTLTIIASVAGIMGGYAFLFDKRFGDLHKRIDDTNRRIDRLEEDVREIQKDIKEIRKELSEIRWLLNRALEIPHREDK